MGSLYDNLSIGDSVEPQVISGSTAVNGAGVDTKGLNTAVIRARGEAASGSPTTATLTVKLQESSDNSTFADALDNTGTVIGFTLTVTSANAGGLARIEGLGLNRKRYLRAVVTPAFTGGTSPASVVFAEILLGRAFTRPQNTATSNT